MIMVIELCHDGWPVDEPKLRRLVGDAQVDEWIADGTLVRREPIPPLTSAQRQRLQQISQPFQQGSSRATD